MNDTNNSQGGSNTSGNNFNNNNTPRPNPVPQTPNSTPTGNSIYGGNGAGTPKFSGMPTAPSGSGNNMNSPQPTPPQQPKPVVPPNPAPTPVPPPAPPTFQQPSHVVPPPMTITPSPTMAPRPAPAPQATGSFSPKPAPASMTVKQNNKGLGITLIVLLILILLGVAVWAFSPFMKAPVDTNIEEKVANPANQPVNNSAFPSGVVNNKPAVAPTKTSNTYSATDQQKITAYIEQNINKLAKTTGYAVDNVTFDGPGRAMVSYSKGSISRSAVVNAYVDSTGAVKVTGFMVLTK